MRASLAATVAAVVVVVTAGGCAMGNGHVRWEDVEKPAKAAPVRSGAAETIAAVEPKHDAPAVDGAPSNPDTPPVLPVTDPTPATATATTTTTPSSDASAPVSNAGAPVSNASAPGSSAPGSNGSALGSSAPGSNGSAPISKASEIVIDGKRVADGGFLNMPALELACMPAADALTEPQKARARFDAAAAKMGVTSSSALSFVVLERDPSRSVSDPPPHWCRSLVDAKGTMKAPLVREKEASSKWLVKKIQKSLVDDAKGLVDANDKKTATAHPRVIVDDTGALLAVALPVSE